MSCACVTVARHRAFGAGGGERHVLGRDAEGHGAEVGAGRGRRASSRLAGDVDARAVLPSPGRKFIPGEPMKWPTKVCCGRSNSSEALPVWTARPRVITTTSLGEGQRLDLVVGDVDQGELQLVVDLLELPPQLPLEMRIDDRERLVEQHRRDVLAHQAAAERDLLLGVGGEAGGALRSAGRSARASRRSGRRAGAMRSGATPRLRSGKAEVLGHGHRVVDDRELEHLGDVALLRRARGDVDAVELHACRATA